MHPLNRIILSSSLYFCCAALLATAALAQPQGKGKKEEKPIPVVVASVKESTLYDSVEVLGSLQSNESIDITANVAERISEVMFTDGQQVKKGDVLVKLEQHEEEADLSVAQVQLSEHTRELERLNTLLKNKAASQRDYDERQTQVKIAGQQLESLQAVLDDRTITAPFDGVLGIRRVSMGALVQPGQLITTLDATHPMKLDFSIPSIYLANIAQGMKVEARTDALKGETFTGTVQTVDTRINPATRAVLVRALVDNPENRLKPGLLMQVSLLKGEHKALTIPEEATTQKQDKHFVFRVKADSTVEEVQITPGIRRTGMLEVREGLQEGDNVVIRGVGLLSDGGKVEVKE